MIVWLSSYPRSGNSYCRFVAYCCRGVQSIDRYSIGVHDSRPYFLNVSGSLESLAAAEETYLVKTHDLPQSGDVWPTLYLVRDGRDSLVSVTLRLHWKPVTTGCDTASPVIQGLFHWP
ncbi:MAG: hypothetical protein ACK5Q5_04430 [Planctomycetaceae bacterium]